MSRFLAMVVAVGWFLVGSTAGAAPPLAAPTAASTATSTAGPDRFMVPVPGPPTILTPFRPPAERWGAGHRGVDLAAPSTAMVRAAGAGTVVFAGQLAGRGVVSIEHTGGLRTTYEPVDPVVSAGAVVSTGTEIGRLQPGHPACAPATCLHWGARIGDSTYLDPMALITGWRVRLLPWDGLK